MDPNVEDNILVESYMTHWYFTYCLQINIACSYWWIIKCIWIQFCNCNKIQSFVGLTSDRTKHWLLHHHIINKAELRFSRPEFIIHEFTQLFESWDVGIDALPSTSNNSLLLELLVLYFSDAENHLIYEKMESNVSYCVFHVDISLLFDMHWLRFCLPIGVISFSATVLNGSTLSPAKYKTNKW